MVAAASLVSQVTGNKQARHITVYLFIDVERNAGSYLKSVLHRHPLHFVNFIRSILPMATNFLFFVSEYSYKLCLSAFESLGIPLIIIINARDKHQGLSSLCTRMTLVGT